MWRPGGNDLPAIDERVELRVVASRFLPEVVTLSIWGIMVRLLAGGQDLPWVSQFPDRFHACISVHCRVPCVPHNGLVYFGAAARPSFEQCGPERKRERERAVCIRRTGRFSILLFVESRFRTGRSIAIDIS